MYTIYKGCVFYSASKPYNLESNKKVIFSLAGTSAEPINLEFDNKIYINKSLKKYRNGMDLKKIKINLHNSLDQCYDFIKPFYMEFKIIYQK